MSLLLLLKPIFHQGHSPPSNDGERRKRRKKVTKKFVERVSQTLELSIPDVRGYIEDVLRKEAEVLQLKQQQLDAEPKATALLEQVDAMMRKAVIAKRRRLNMIIASILDWI
jgi:hypothetical protein